MQAYPPGQGVDLGDGIQLRTHYEGFRGWLEGERAPWLGIYGDLARFVLPKQQRFNYSDTNNGERRDYRLMDNTGTMAHRVLTASLVSGICSPTRNWFDFKAYSPHDRKINERKDVRIYLEETADIVRASLLRSNWYQTAHTCFGEQSLYGTSAFMIQEDALHDARCYPWPVGSYYLAGDATNRINLFMRVVQKTVLQIVEEFGLDNCSSAVRQLYNSPTGGGKEQWYPVVQVIHKTSYFGEAWARKHPEPWMSCWYELGPYKVDGSKPDNGMLRRGFFYECPVMAPRWNTVGEDIYGISPAMEALGDIMGLQATDMMVSKAIDKSVDPPMVAHPSLANQKLGQLPGDTLYADTRDGSLGFRPAFQVKFDISHGIAREQEIRNRINEAFYKNLFMLHSDSDRRDITAEEIRARQEEKMMVIGPVLERSNVEFLEPGLFRWLAILGRRNKLPPMPEAMKDGGRIAVEFSSMLAQAQKMLGMANIDRFMAAVGQEAAVNQGVFDIVDLDKTVRVSADLLNVPPEMIREQKDVDKIRADKARQMQQQQQAENASKMALAAKNLSATDTSGQNGLTDLIHANTGAGP